MGVIEASAANPQKDYGRALTRFRQVVHDFPGTRRAAAAAAWIPLLEEQVSAEHQGRVHLRQVQLLAADGRFDEALRENDKQLATDGPCADAALFGRGLILTAPNNPNQDRRKALDAFSQLTAEYPSSPYAQQGRTWRAILSEEFSPEREGGALLNRVRLLLRSGDYAGALRQIQEPNANDRSKRPPEAAVLFATALIFADHGNPWLDRKKAIGSLNQLVKEHTESPLAEDARIWLASLKIEVSPEREGLLHMQRVQQLLRKGDFDGALRENQRVLSSGVKGAPADAALYSLGLLFADPANPKMDYKKSAGYLTKLRREHSGSPYAEEARVLLGVLTTMEKALRVDFEIDEKKNEVRR